MARIMLKVVLAAAIVAASLSSHRAAAQMAGTYGGQQANGQPFNLIVDRYKGNLIVNVANIGAMTATCGNGTTLSEANGVGTVGHINNGSGHFGIEFGAIYIHMTYFFDDATHSVSGYVFQDVGQFTTMAPGVPKKATFCPTGSMAFAAVLDRNANFDTKQVFGHHNCAAANGGTGPCVASLGR